MVGREQQPNLTSWRDDTFQGTVGVWSYIEAMDVLMHMRQYVLLFILWKSLKFYIFQESLETILSFCKH